MENRRIEESVEEVFGLNFDAPELAEVLPLKVQSGITAQKPTYFESLDGRHQIAWIGESLYTVSYYEEPSVFEKCIETKNTATPHIIKDLQNPARYKESSVEKFNLVFRMYLESLKALFKKFNIEL